MQIQYVNHGIGNNFGDTIELNENLKRWPRLHKAILDHELKHTDQVFTKHDLMVDLTESKVNTKELIMFMFENPKSFSQFLPFYYTKNRGLVYDINLSITYMVVGILIVGVSYWATTL